MNYRHIARTAVLAGSIGMLSACSDLTGLNDNPNGPTDVSAEFLFPQAIRSGVETTFGAGLMLSHTGIWAGHFAQIQYPDEEQAHLRPGSVDNFWDSYYVGPLNDIQEVIEKGQAAGVANHSALGTIWRSWLFHQVTDLWGDIPYTAALAGRDNTTPTYDTQQAVYTGLLADLTAAVAALDPAGDGFGSGDILYGNDMEKWRRFANSLRMRLAMRMVNADPATAQTEFVAAYNAGGFQDNADNAMLAWPGAPYENVLYENYLGRDDHSISGAMVDTLLSLTDPRLQLYAEEAELGTVPYVGHYNGYAKPPLAIGYYSRIGNFWRADGAATPTAIMTYAEVLFLQAEAAERGWIAGSAADLYEAAITANMEQYDGLAANNPTEAEIAAYLANPGVAYTGLEDIHLQLWIALYANANETWSHWRRTGVPSLTVGPDVAGGQIPVRFPYPGGEQSYNAANLATASQNQGMAVGGDLVTPLWWMQ